TKPRIIGMTIGATMRADTNDKIAINQHTDVITVGLSPYLPLTRQLMDGTLSLSALRDDPQPAFDILQWLQVSDCEFNQLFAFLFFVLCLLHFRNSFHSCSAYNLALGYAEIVDARAFCDGR